MILDISWALVLACLAAAFAGAVVQGTLGIGLGMVASPVLALVDPAFIPGAVLVAVLPLTIGIALTERASVDRRGVAIALIGRVPGALAGAAAVAWAGPDALAVLVGVSVLAAVGLSLTRVRFRTTDGRVLVAGVASGFTGTATGIGGPPMALTYQHGDPAVMRSTLSAFFTVGSAMSIGVLVATGGMTGRQWQLGALLAPAVIAGLLVAQHFARALRDERARAGVLLVCGVSAAALLVEVLAH